MIEKFRESDYQKEYNEITEVYNSQMKPLKNKWLIVFIAISTIISTYIFFALVGRMPILLVIKNGVKSTYSSIAGISYFIPGTYFIRLRQVIRHKNRRLKNLEEKKTKAVSAGIYDANA